MQMKVLMKFRYNANESSIYNKESISANYGCGPFEQVWNIAAVGLLPTHLYAVSTIIKSCSCMINAKYLSVYRVNGEW